MALLWRDGRRHGDRRPLRIGLVGAGLLAVGIVGNLLAVRGARMATPEPLAVAPVA